MIGQKGFSIIEISIAMAIMGLMSVGLAGMIKSQADQVFYVEDKLVHQDMKMAMDRLLRDDTICTNMLSTVKVPGPLGSISTNPAGTIVIKDSTNALIYDPSDDTKNKFDKLKISNIRIENVDVVDETSGNRVNILIDVNRIRGIASQALQSISIPKNVTIDGTRLITNCSGNGAGEYLELVTTKNFKGSGISGAISSYTMPSDIKAFSLTTKGSACNWETGSSPNNDQHSTFQSGINIRALLNGKHKNNGTAILAGKTLRYVSGKYYYDGILVASMAPCMSYPSQHNISWTNHPFSGGGPQQTNFDYPQPAPPVLGNLRTYK